MQEPIRARKQALRAQVQLALKGLGQEARAAASSAACARLKAETVWQEARSIMCFAPLPGELDIWPLVEEAAAAGKRLALPRFVPASKAYEACVVQSLERDLKLGHFNIREPASHCAPFTAGRLDLILVPGVAFDLQGHRLGRGKGYYDGLLTALRKSLGTLALPTICAVAFDEQILGEVPAEAHDVRMDLILTPTRWIKAEDS